MRIVGVEAIKFTFNIKLKPRRQIIAAQGATAINTLTNPSELNKPNVQNIV